MALKDTVKKMHALLEELSKDLSKAAEKGNKAASQRVRTNTIKFAKLSKQYRKESITSERGSKKTKRAAKKKSVKKKVSTKRAPTRKKKVAKKRKSR
jgi:hypothetical protein